MNGLFGIFLLSIHGLAIISVLERWTKTKIDAALATASSFLIGSVWVTWLLSLQSYFGVMWSQIVLYIDLFCAVAITGLWVIPKRKQLLSALTFKQNRIDLAIISAILFTLWAVLWSSELSHEFVHSDSQNYWFLRATMFYKDRGVSVDRLKSLPFTAEVPDPRGNTFPVITFIPVQYPLLVPLTMDYLYGVLGTIQAIPAKYLWLGVEWSITLLLYAVAKTCFPQKRTLRFLPIILFYLIPNTTERFGIHVFGFADVWLGGFWLIALWSLYVAQIHKQLSYSLLGFVAMCGILMTKVEGMVGMWLVPFLMYQFKTFRVSRKVWLFCGMFLLLSVFWYIESNGIQPHGFIQKTIVEISQGKSDILLWPSTIRAFIIDLATVTTHGLVWWIFFPLYLFLIWKRTLPLFVSWLWLSVWLGLGSALFVYLTMEIGPLTTSMSFIISGTLTRFSVQWYPTVIAFILIGYMALVKTKKSH